MDVGASMCAGGFKARTIETIQSLLLQKLMHHKNDRVLVMLAGTEDADNHLRPGGGEVEGVEYDHIVELPSGAASTFDAPNVACIRSLSKLPDSTASVSRGSHSHSRSVDPPTHSLPHPSRGTGGLV